MNQRPKRSRSNYQSSHHRIPRPRSTASGFPVPASVTSPRLARSPNPIIQSQPFQLARPRRLGRAQTRAAGPQNGCTGNSSNSHGGPNVESENRYSEKNMTENIIGNECLKAQMTRDFDPWSIGAGLDCSLLYTLLVLSGKGWAKLQYCIFVGTYLSFY